MLDRILRTEPARVGEALLSIVAVLATVTDLIDPAQAAGVIAAIVAVLEVVRSIVYSPASVEMLVLDAARKPRD